MLCRHLLCVKPFLGNFINFDLRVKIDKCYFEPIRTEQIFVQKNLLYTLNEFCQKLSGSFIYEAFRRRGTYSILYTNYLFLCKEGIRS